MASRGFARPAVFWDSSGVDISAMYANGFEPHIVFNPSYNNVYKEVGSSNTNTFNALGESQGTFTRGSTGTYIDDDGGYASVSSHEPRTFNGRLLMEPQRTNQLLQSEALGNASWTKTNATITDDDTNAPDGNATADKVVEDATAGAHGVEQSISSNFSADETGVLSAFAVPSGRDWVRLTLVETTTGDEVRVWFDVSSGTVGQTTAQGNTTLVDSGFVNGTATQTGSFYRPYIVATPSSGETLSTAQVLLADADGSATYTGDGSSAAHVWGAQAESGSFPTSYIPTSGSTVTRNADTLDPLSDYTKGYDASEGLTLYVKGVFNYGDGDFDNTNQAIGQINFSSSNYLGFQSRSTGKVRAISKAAGTISVSDVGTGHARGDTVELTIREQQSGFAVQYSINGGAVQDASVSLGSNHTDGLTGDRAQVGGFAGEVIAFHVARGDHTLKEMRTLAR